MQSSIIIVIAGVFLTLGLVFYKRIYFIVGAYRELLKMLKTCLKTSQFNKDIYVLRDGHANVYLVKNGDGYLAIDGGDKPKNTLAALNELRVKPEEVNAVFLTHTDFDHCGAIEVFKNAKVYLAKAEECLIDGTRTRTFSKYEIKHGNKLEVPYRTLADGEVIKSGNRTVECVLTPGHTPGSMSFVVDGKYLFTGDLMKLVDGKATNFIELFTIDMDTDSASIKKLAAETRSKDIEYVFTAHHGYSDNHKNVFQGW